MDRLKIGIIFGGCSEEHPVSVKSAQEVAKTPRPRKVRAVLDRDHDQTAPGSCVTAPARTGRATAAARSCCHRTEASTGCSSWSRDRYEMIRLDLVLPVLHGKLGEDGAIQGLLELVRHPLRRAATSRAPRCAWTSPWPTSSPEARESPRRTSGPSRRTRRSTLTSFTYPVFVKPARSGSSFGVSKVSRRRGTAGRGGGRTAVRLEGADRRGRRRQRGRLRHPGERFGLVAGEVDRVALSHGFFRIHQESEPESGSENSTFIVPADISAESRSLVQETAKTIYRALGCKGLARVDMFLTRTTERSCSTRSTPCPA